MSGYMSQNVVICEECGKVVHGALKKCPYCGSDIAFVKVSDEQGGPKEERVKCPICGSNRTGSGHCYACGYDFAEEEEETETAAEESPATERGSRKTSGVVIFLAVVLGIIAAAWIVSKIFYVEVTGTLSVTK